MHQQVRSPPPSITIWSHRLSPDGLPASPASTQRGLRNPAGCGRGKKRPPQRHLGVPESPGLPPQHTPRDPRAPDLLQRARVERSELAPQGVRHLASGAAHREPPAKSPRPALGGDPGPAANAARDPQATGIRRRLRPRRGSGETRRSTAVGVAWQWQDQDTRRSRSLSGRVHKWRVGVAGPRESGWRVGPKPPVGGARAERSAEGEPWRKAGPELDRLMGVA